MRGERSVVMNTIWHRAGPGLGRLDYTQTHSGLSTPGPEHILSSQSAELRLNIYFVLRTITFTLSRAIFYST